MCSEHHDAAALSRVVPARPGADPEVETIPLEPVDSVTITTLVDNVADMLLANRGPARRPALGAGPTVPAATLEPGRTAEALVAEHGFSALVVVRRGEREHRILFDTGLSPDAMVENMRRLGLSPGDVEAVVCSHGHFDHTTGLDGFVRAVGRANLPVVIHPDFWLRRRIAVPGREPFEMPSTSRRALEGAGFEVVERRQPSFLFENSVLVTGEVDRTTAFERGFPAHQAWRAGAWEPDPLILDDQALVVHVRDAGLVVLTGCGHAGIVNVARHARRLTGVERLHAVLGGFHLSGPFEPVIAPTVDALAALAPDVVVPAHCTGWKAVHAIAARLPDAFVPNSVGTRYELAAAPA